jgi:hypothetical protein
MAKKKAARQSAESALKILRLFNEKADHLRSSSYTKQIASQRLTIHWDNATKETSIADIRPEEESREAMILTLRFFYHELKFENVVALYNDLPISEEQKTWVYESFDAFSQEMQAGTGIKCTVRGSTYTSKQIFETFMFGQYCHAQEPLAERLKLFAENPCLFVIFKQEFDCLVSLHLKFIFWLSRMNDVAIKALLASSTPN